MRCALHIPTDAEQAAKREEFAPMLRADRPAVSMEAIAEERLHRKIARRVALRLKIDARPAIEGIERALKQVTRFHSGGVVKTPVSGRMTFPKVEPILSAPKGMRRNEVAVIMSTPQFGKTEWIRQHFENGPPPRSEGPFAWPSFPTHEPIAKPGEFGLAARGRGSVKFMSELLGQSETEMKGVPK